MKTALIILMLSVLKLGYDWLLLYRSYNRILKENEALKRENAQIRFKFELKD